MGLAPNDLDVQSYVRFMVSGATECPIDNQGPLAAASILARARGARTGSHDRRASERASKFGTSRCLTTNQSGTQEDFQRIASVVAGLDR